MSHGRDTSPKPFGVVAEFKSAEDLLEAAKAVKARGYRDVEAYSPIPVHGLTDVLEFKDEKLSFIVFAHGVLGLGLGYALQWWTSGDYQFFGGDAFWQVNGLNGYAHNVGGKPLFSLPAFFPPAYELTILLAAFGAVFGMFALNGLPKPHHPVFNAESMTRASGDSYCLSIEASDPRYDEEAVSDLFRELGAVQVEAIKTSEGY